MRWISKFYFDLNKIWEGSFILISVEFSPLNVLCNCRHLFMRVVFVRTAFVISVLRLLRGFPYHRSWRVVVLSSVRDALLTGSFYDIIDDDEFVLLYDTYSSKPIFPYWKFPRFSVDEWSDVEYKTELRLAKKHLPELCECLGIPEKITCVQKTVCGGMEGLCILLKRLAYPCRYTDMVPRFGRNPTELWQHYDRFYQRLS